MAVVAKMQCIQNKAPDWDANQRSVRLNAVYEDNGLNKAWSKWTPSGEASLAITNPEAFSQFELGATYLVTFTKVDNKTERPIE